MSTDNSINLKEFQLHDTDTGSASYQTALLTGRIRELTEHMKRNPKDFSSRRGLIKLVSLRRRHLDYIKAKSEDNYLQIIKSLGLRR